MRRSRLPSDSPSIVTRPGVNRISIALWVISIHDGCASGRQSGKMRTGRPAFSSANICSIFLAACSFQGGGLVFIWASWSVIFGFQTPLQSGSLPMSVQSCGVGGGFMRVAGFLGASAVETLDTSFAATLVVSLVAALNTSLAATLGGSLVTILGASRKYTKAAANAKPASKIPDSQIFMGLLHRNWNCGSTITNIAPNQCTVKPIQRP